MSTWDWTQVATDVWDNFKSKVLAIIESDPLIEAGVRIVKKPVNTTVQAAGADILNPPLVLGKSDRNTADMKCYKCGKLGHI